MSDTIEDFATQFNCEVCHQEFESKTMLEEHINTCQNPQEQITKSVEKIISGLRADYQCD